MLVEEDYITVEIRRTTKNKKIEINTATKHDDMFITSYDIELGKANKNFDFSTTKYFLNGINGVQVVLLIQKEADI